MHRIIEAHLKSFVESYGLAQHQESAQFEMFVNHAVLASKICGDFDLDDGRDKGDVGTKATCFML